MPVTGNGPGELARLIARMQDVSRGRALEPLTKALSTEAMARVKSCFEESRSPYGEPWAPVSRGGKPLENTNRLRNAFLNDSRPGRIEINNPTIYARLMNEGGIVEAKNKPYLVFQMKLAGAARAIRGGVVTARARGTKQWVKVKRVVIKARQFIPDGRGLPATWETAMVGVAQRVMERFIGRKAA